MLSLGGSTVTVDLSGLDALQRRTDDLRPLFAGSIDRSVTKLFERQFASEGAWGGVKWAQHRALTRTLRARPGHGRGGILRDTNRLWASFVKSGGPESVRRITASEYVRGSSVPYARAHQRGFPAVVFGRRTGRRVPARPIVPNPVPREVVATWERLVRDYVLTGKT